MTKLIEGKDLSIIMKNEIANEVRILHEEGKRSPHLAAILVGDEGASKTYIGSKEKACKEVGFEFSLYRFPTQVSQQELLNCIDFLNNDPEIDGYIVQLPLPKQINEEEVIFRIDPSKDIDGFHPQNIGRFILGAPSYIPATPMGIMTMIERFQIETEGKHCVIVGRSNIVGTPMAILLSRNEKYANATVTLCHSKTRNLKEMTSSADILIAAIGRPEFIKADMVKKGAVVIDVGVNRVEDLSSTKGYKIVGDVDFKEVSEVASAITPVPGGVGPMTIVSLLRNTLKAYRKEVYN